MIRLRLAASSLLFACIVLHSARAASIDLTSGTPGTFPGGQSFNETRGIEITVLTATDQALSSMTLSGLSVFAPGATVGARVYESSSMFLLAYGDVSVVTGTNQSVTMPVDAILRPGQSYRVCFFVDSPGPVAGTMFDPNPAGSGGIPYVVTGGALRVEGAFTDSLDVFPGSRNIFVPMIALDLCEPTTQIDATSGTTGTISSSPQSFNETRALAVTLAPDCGDFPLVSMRLDGVTITAASSLIGARVYDEATQVLLATGQTTVSTGANQSVVVPITATLSAGASYRIGFFVDSGGTGSAATFFDPSPVGSGGFPYVDATGRLTIHQAYQFPADAFPTNVNNAVPRMTLNAPAIDSEHVAFCFGDGADPSHSTGCPCGNLGAHARGCANSVNPSGARLRAQGPANPDQIVLAADGMPATVTCIYIQQDALGDSQFGDGVSCASGTLIRLRAKSNVGGASQFPEPSDTVSVSQRGGVTPGSGVTRYYAAYYRNASATFCPPLTYNITNGRRIVW